MQRNCALTKSMMFLKCFAWYNEHRIQISRLLFKWISIVKEKEEEEIDERIFEHLGRLISIQPSFGKHGKIDHPSVTLAFSISVGRRKEKRESRVFRWKMARVHVWIEKANFWKAYNFCYWVRLLWWMKATRHTIQLPG